MSSRIATVINFCSNDYPFLRPCIDAVKSFSSQIIVPVCDHFFDGKPEDRKVLNAIYAENSDVQFIEFPYDPNHSLYGSHSSVYWHNLSRMVGRFFLKEESEYVLFLDCDEICDTPRFTQWLSANSYSEYDAIRFFNYWYFREPHLQAKAWEASPLLARKQLLYGEGLMREQERGS
ncbi:MAG: hypothetical protein HYX67_16350, partial [Candidatus Melainabacteria bacterium]|nr:hypothetical protein [Candidatus Melainabacteria bacterium]